MRRKLREAQDYEGVEKLAYQKEVLDDAIQEAEETYHNIDDALFELTDAFNEITAYLEELTDVDVDVDSKKIVEKLKSSRTRAEEIVDDYEQNIRDYASKIKNYLKKFDNLYRKMS